MTVCRARERMREGLADRPRQAVFQTLVGLQWEGQAWELTVFDSKPAAGLATGRTLLLSDWPGAGLRRGFT